MHKIEPTELNPTLNCTQLYCTHTEKKTDFMIENKPVISGKYILSRGLASIMLYNIMNTVVTGFHSIICL